MMVPLKVSMLSEKIAIVYLDVSNKYIMPAQRYVCIGHHTISILQQSHRYRSVGSMMEFTDDTSEKGRAALRGRLLYFPF